MKKSMKHFAKTATKPTAKVVERPYSLLGVDNMLSVKGPCLLMNAEDAAPILQHTRTKYPRLVLAKDVVLRLPQERKNAVLLKATDGTSVLRRTSDLFQTPTPVLSEKAREKAKEDAAKSKAARVAAPKGFTAVKSQRVMPKMLGAALDAIKAKGAKGASSVRLHLDTKTGATVLSPKAPAKTPVKASTPPAAAPAAPAPATAAVAPVGSQS